MNSFELDDFFESVYNINLTESQKNSFEKISKTLNRYILSGEENLFSSIASCKQIRLSKLLKLSVPGEETCFCVEQMRQAFFKGESRKKIVGLYYSGFVSTTKYLFPESRFDEQSVFEVLLFLYETFLYKCINIDNKIYQSVKNKDSFSYKTFFEHYLSQFRAKMKDILEIPGFGATRNASLSYRKVIALYIELLLTYIIFFSYSYELASESFNLFVKRMTEEVMNSSDLFYKLWIDVNNEIIYTAYEKELFSDYLSDFQNTYSRFLIESKAYSEKNIIDLPVAKESDMRALYKTVYDLQNEVKELKKELKEIKGC